MARMDAGIAIPGSSNLKKKEILLLILILKMVIVMAIKCTGAELAEQTSARWHSKRIGWSQFR